LTTQRIISALFSVFINVWSVLNLLLILATPHSYDSIDIDYWIVAILSLMISPVCSLFLIQAGRKDSLTDTRLMATNAFLGLTALILLYYTLQLWTDEHSSVTFYQFLPVLALTANIWLMLVIWRRRKAGNTTVK
jgi:uncharacterized membrane-anchored protein